MLAWLIGGRTRVLTATVTLSGCMMVTATSPQLDADHPGAQDFEPHTCPSKLDKPIQDAKTPRVMT